MSKKVNVSFRFFACTQIADRDGTMPFSSHVDDALYEFDRHVHAVATTQNALNKLVLAFKQL